ncbi:cation:dicarboxylate symporter family transporter [Bythopirellula goksoeyrii]|nr:cation:dicarboxylase symporter family transporter [Bythopirellula goksoeyrii]
MGLWIALGLLLGILCGVFFGEYCEKLDVIGKAYVGLLQMTVLPYLVFSLIAKMGRLDVDRAKKLGVAALTVLLAMGLIGVLLIVLVSCILPAIKGASFYSPSLNRYEIGDSDALAQFVPTNIFRSLADEYVPAVVVFCLFFGCSLMLVRGKEQLLDFLDVCSDAIGRVNLFLIRLAPLGLFALSAAAAGTIRIEELSRLQAYLIMFTIACVIAAFGVLPLIVCSFTEIRYRDLFHAAQEPLLTVIATGKLFVVLPQIAEKCEQLLKKDEDSTTDIGETTPGVLVPLAYSVPHLGKLFAFIFVSFGAWYVGRGLSPSQTAGMAATGTLSSFASPLITIPYQLDQFHLPQDLMALFILPGFATTRLADVVGVLHLMVVTILVTKILQKRLRVNWWTLAASTLLLFACTCTAFAVSRWYLATTTPEYDLDQRLLAMEIADPYADVQVYQSRDDVTVRPPSQLPTLERVKAENLLRVGYHPDHLPFSFFNNQQHLVGLDVELMHRLAESLGVKLEFVPFSYNTVSEQLETGEIDIALGGLIVNLERLKTVGFTQPYQTATIAIVVPDHRRGEFDTWNNSEMPTTLRLGVVYKDMAVVARRKLPDAEIVVIDSIGSFFDQNQQNLDGLIMAAEEGATWNVLYPEHTVVTPRPIVRRPVAMAVRPDDVQWVRFLDGWLEFERLDGAVDSLRSFWIEGDGAKQRSPRWSVVRDVLHWLP